MYYTAGYYLVIPKHEQGTVNGHTFTNRSWSVSTYISHVYPGIWGFKWAYSNRQVPKAYSPLPEELASLHTWIEAEFGQGNYGWPGFFLSQEKAFEFKHKFLAALPGVKLLGIFLHEEYYAAALTWLQPNNGTEWTDLRTLLGQQVVEPSAGEEIGFDLLGLLDFGGYEPFSYHVLEAEYQHTFGIALNTYGLFTKPADCQQVAAYTDTIADEPAFWLPFKVKLFACHS
ncbi:hypothetical protein [Hymenobacter cellulosilyticus]|uniref:Uncharacterized protein n=1 Tax=Hymenobacter cellulosilyticus TaxID=2932248 RepID=A0A8T9QAH7_9BACT|nr:hypothetical protein [Hymenobacter cellulosilyticus]UOQ74002.1 hypothetical protein MUN79_08960 [Hymenobacter cellulosilyticus]